MKVRLQKYLADCGVASRRRAELFIVEGRVRVNDELITELGFKVDENDDVYFEGELVTPVNKNIYIMLNKPKGVLSTVSKTNEEGDTVIDLIGIRDRIFPIGRLDKDSSGLIILTNDGDMALKLTHPRYEKEKEYEVVVHKPLDDELFEAFENGVILDGKRTLPAKIIQKSDRVFNIVLKEGRKRQIRRICADVHYSVKNLHRVRINNLRIGNFPLGEWKYMSDDEIDKLVG